METGKVSDIYLLLFAGTLVLFLLAVAVVAFIYMYRKRITKQQLAIQEMQHKIQFDILQNNIDLLETERKRFAEDLHDDIGSKLAALRLNILQLQLTKNDIDITETLTARSKEIIDAVVGNVRRISHNILPPSLEMFGLANALEELRLWISTSSSLTVHIDYQLADDALEQKKELAVYRIVQELMSNTIRHAQASNIVLTANKAGNKCKLLYKDDGKGIAATKKSKTTGIGFKNIEDRVNSLKGKIDFPAAEKGFCCEIIFPTD